jgi:hypothetical protein
MVELAEVRLVAKRRSSIVHVLNPMALPDYFFLNAAGKSVGSVLFAVFWIISKFTRSEQSPLRAKGNILPT